MVCNFIITYCVVIFNSSHCPELHRYDSLILISDFHIKQNAVIAHVRQDRFKKVVSLPDLSVVESTLVKQQITVNTEMPTASTIAFSLSRSPFEFRVDSTPSKLTFKDIFAAEFEGFEEKYIKGFDGWLDCKSLVDAVKTVFHDMASSKF